MPAKICKNNPVGIHRRWPQKEQTPAQDSCDAKAGFFMADGQFLPCETNMNWPARDTSWASAHGRRLFVAKQLAWDACDIRQFLDTILRELFMADDLIVCSRCDVCSFEKSYPCQANCIVFFLKKIPVKQTPIVLLA